MFVAQKSRMCPLVLDRGQNVQRAAAFPDRARLTPEACGSSLEASRDPLAFGLGADMQFGRPLPGSGRPSRLPLDSACRGRCFTCCCARDASWQR